ncbi:hypothetical protein M422DRAFT_40684 [Sphaerobolus stellatus SS14]|nr:hypothetical protein M422DRAFT_40684 [Sphaerobolus stellatus SS14]
MYTAPRTMRLVLPGELACWDREPYLAQTAKDTQLAKEKLVSVEPWFGESLNNLAERLHGFFSQRFIIEPNALSELDPEGTIPLTLVKPKGVFLKWKPRNT